MQLIETPKNSNNEITEGHKENEDQKLLQMGQSFIPTMEVSWSSLFASVQIELLRHEEPNRKEQRKRRNESAGAAVF